MAESTLTSHRAIAAWCSYDWANSAHPTVIATFVFGTYVAQAVAPDPVTGQALWGQAMGWAGLGIALLAPLTGAVADLTGRRKLWLALFTAACVLSTGSLWFVAPDPSWLLLGLVIVAVSLICFEIATVFYNSLLPSLVPRERVGRVSGWAWGLGYAGGLVCLVVALTGLVQADPAPFGLDSEQAEPVRATALLVALWYGLFSLPLFFLVPEPPAQTQAHAGPVLREAFRGLAATIRKLSRAPGLGRFFLARMLYIDGLNTLFALGGVFAAGAFGMDVAGVITFGIALNVTAGLGAAAAGWLDDRFGPKPTILVSLVALIVLSAALLLVRDVTWFWILGCALGLFFGPVQASSRSLVAKVAPPALRAELFGLFALSGKITAFAGPMAVGLLTAASGSQRVGMAAIVVFLVAGAVLLLFTRVDTSQTDPGLT